MKEDEQAFKMLGFAHRAGKLTFGMSATLGLLKKGKTSAIILANDISKNSEKKLQPLAAESKVPIFRCGTKRQFGDFFGRQETGIIGIRDASFAKAIRKIFG